MRPPRSEQDVDVRGRRRLRRFPNQLEIAFFLRMPAASGAIKAKTLIMVGTKDLLNPEWEPRDAARYIRDVRVATISPGTVTGHASAGGAMPADVDFLNGEIGAFLDLVTQKGKKLE